MIIIKLTAESNGAHANQTGNFNIIPDGYSEVPENFLATWEQYRPFVTLTVVDGAITDMADNPEARAAQAAIDAQVAASALPTVETDIMSMSVEHEYRLTLLELGVSI